MVKIGVLGSGVVGQATGIGLADKGHHVTFLDVNPEVVVRLRQAGYQAVLTGELGRRGATIQVWMICIPTPTVHGRIDLGALCDAAVYVGRWLAIADGYPIVVLRSTVPPTTTESVLIPALEQHSRKQAGREFGVCMNPEFLRQATAREDFARPWLTVIGTHDARAASILEGLLTPFGAPVVITDLRTAEMAKYVHNLFNAAKISYFNEVHMICEKLGIDSATVSEIVSRSAEGIWNPHYGTRGGYPFDGACLPKDTAAFLNFAQERGWPMPLLQAVIAVNNEMARRARLAERKQHSTLKVAVGGRGRS